jgi:hypothetical protein
MTTIIEYPQPPMPDPVGVIITIIVELIQTLIEKRVITKTDARRLLEDAAKKLSADKRAVGPRNSRFVRNLAKAYFK